MKFRHTFDVLNYSHLIEYIRFAKLLLGTELVAVIRNTSLLHDVTQPGPANDRVPLSQNKGKVTTKFSRTQTKK